MRAPSHTHWIVDLIVKSSHSSSDVCDFVSDWIELYDKIKLMGVVWYESDEWGEFRFELENDEIKVIFKD